MARFRLLGPLERLLFECCGRDSPTTVHWRFRFVGPLLTGFRYAIRRCPIRYYHYTTASRSRFSLWETAVPYVQTRRTDMFLIEVRL